jgi:hypothetical protein
MELVNLSSSSECRLIGGGEMGDGVSTLTYYSVGTEPKNEVIGYRDQVT